MALRKRSKVNAQFNMSSLTDIIFLLLIFFMLTSTVVAPHALNLKMPGRADTPATPGTQDLDDVSIDGNGNFYLNSRQITQEKLESSLGKLAHRDKSILISPDATAPVESVVAVMDMAMRLAINGVLVAEE